MNDLVSYLRYIAALPSLAGHSIGVRSAAGEAANEIERRLAQSNRFESMLDEALNENEQLRAVVENLLDAYGCPIVRWPQAEANARALIGIESQAALTKGDQPVDRK